MQAKYDCRRRIEKVPRQAVLLGLLLRKETMGILRPRSEEGPPRSVSTRDSRQSNRPHIYKVIRKHIKNLILVSIFNAQKSQSIY